MSGLTLGLSLYRVHLTLGRRLISRQVVRNVSTPPPSAANIFRKRQVTLSRTIVSVLTLGRSLCRVYLTLGRRLISRQVVHNVSTPSAAIIEIIFKPMSKFGKNL